MFGFRVAQQPAINYTYKFSFRTSFSTTLRLIMPANVRNVRTLKSNNTPIKCHTWPATTGFNDVIFVRETGERVRAQRVDWCTRVISRLNDFSHHIQLHAHHQGGQTESIDDGTTSSNQATYSTRNTHTKTSRGVFLRYSVDLRLSQTF